MNASWLVPCPGSRWRPLLERGGPSVSATAWLAAGQPPRKRPPDGAGLGRHLRCPVLGGSDIKPSIIIADASEGFGAESESLSPGFGVQEALWATGVLCVLSLSKNFSGPRGPLELVVPPNQRPLEPQRWRELADPKAPVDVTVVWTPKPIAGSHLALASAKWT